MTVGRGHPMWCRVYARKTPSIPVHNGHNKCIGCGFDLAAYRAAHAPLIVGCQSPQVP